RRRTASTRLSADRNAEGALHCVIARHFHRMYIPIGRFLNFSTTDKKSLLNLLYKRTRSVDLDGVTRVWGKWTQEDTRTHRWPRRRAGSKRHPGLSSLRTLTACAQCHALTSLF